jgi:hypothetical protein
MVCWSIEPDSTGSPLFRIPASSAARQKFARERFGKHRRVANENPDKDIM